ARGPFVGVELHRLARNRRARIAERGSRLCGTLHFHYWQWLGEGVLSDLVALCQRSGGAFSCPFLHCPEWRRPRRLRRRRRSRRGTVSMARCAGLPATLVALRAAVATCVPAGLRQPEAVTFLAPLASAFAEILLAAGKSTFAMLHNLSRL